MKMYLLYTALILSTANPVLASELKGTVNAQSNTNVFANASTQRNSAERVSPRIYSVTVDGDRKDTREDVVEKALYKAAKKTLKYDYDWFRVVETDIDRERIGNTRSSKIHSGFETRPYRECGLLGCTTTHRTNYNSRISSNGDSRSRVYYSVVLEYEMGKGQVLNPGEIYDANQAKREFK